MPNPCPLPCPIQCGSLLLVSGQKIRTIGQHGQCHSTEPLSHSCATTQARQHAGVVGTRLCYTQDCTPTRICVCPPVRRHKSGASQNQRTHANTLPQLSGGALLRLCAILSEGQCRETYRGPPLEQPEARAPRRPGACLCRHKAAQTWDHDDSTAHRHKSTSKQADCG